MPGCAAVGCTNSAKKGFLMKRFPKDPIRRKEWLVKSKRDKWTPSDHSCLCEVHFAPEMWEKTRVDGTRKLKINAVPTIFAFVTSTTAKRKPPMIRTIKSLPCQILEPENDDEQPTNVIDANEIESRPSTSKATNLLETFNSQVSNDKGEIKSQVRLTAADTVAILTAKLGVYERIYLKEKQKTKNYQRLLRNAKHTINRLKADAIKDVNLLKHVFNEDQILALKKKQRKKTTKFMKWSNNTVTKALKLKFSCGGSGYRELLKQGCPLPSIRTLQRSKWRNF